MINRLFSAFFVRRLSLSRRVLALKDALRYSSAVHRNLIASYNIILEFLFRRIRLNCGVIQDAEITQGCAAERLMSVRLRHPASKIESNASPNCIDFRYVFQCVCVCVCVPSVCTTSFSTTRPPSHPLQVAIVLILVKVRSLSGCFLAVSLMTASNVRLCVCVCLVGYAACSCEKRKRTAKGPPPPIECLLVLRQELLVERLEQSEHLLQLFRLG